MIYHSIRLTFKPDVTGEQREVAFDQWHKMAKEIPAVEFYSIGRDIGGEYEYGAMFALKDIAAYEEFVMHPAGKETDLVGLPLVSSIASMDLTDDEDPDIAEKIDEIHRVRFDRDPEVLDLVNNMLYSGSGGASSI